MRQVFLTIVAVALVVSYYNLRLDPFWDPLLGHPRFQALLKKYEIE